MPIQTLIKPGRYYDSVSLMQVAQSLTKLEGVDDAAVVMATEANKAVLREVGMLTAEAEEAGPNDLVITVSISIASPDEIGQEILAQVEILLSQSAVGHDSVEFRPKTTRGAIKNNSKANLAVISVAGQYAPAEAWDALHQGLPVLLFSDNVSLEDELALKSYARDHGLLMMGPDAGTAIINGVALGFANVVPPGSVGIVAASGTGLQEVSTLLAKLGVGLSQALGVGGRDVHPAIGGMMMLEGLKALQADPATEFLTLITKPPAPEVTERILSQVQASDKPTVVCFLGGDNQIIAQSGAIAARTLQEAAYLTARLVEGDDTPSAAKLLDEEMKQLVRQATDLKKLLTPRQKFIRGLFSGGTLAIETLLLLADKIEPIWSNVALDERWHLEDVSISKAHTIVDLGEDEFTIGRPHPMLDHTLRIQRLLQEAEDPTVAVIMLDVVLGYGTHPEPATELSRAIRQAKTISAARGQKLGIVGSVTGTESDPQILSKQVAALEASGMIVLPSNAAAAKLAGLIVSSQTKKAVEKKGS